MRPCRSHHYKKPTTWVVTPRVRKAVREHFDCPTLKGMAMEDIPMSGGAGSHWEARLMGPEVRTSTLPAHAVSGYPATLLPCYPATLLPCYPATLLPCYPATLLPCCRAIAQPCWRAIVLPC
jgi:hypothetical protein